MTKVTRAVGVIAVMGLLGAAACSSDDDATSQSAASAAPATDVDEPTTEPPETTPDTAAPETDPPATEVPVTEPPETTEPEADEPPVTAASDEAQLLDFEFQPVPAGRYRVETIGAPFLIDIPDGWFVQPNSFGHFVITDPESRGPGDRDIVMIRPSGIADPDQPGAPLEEQAGDWPLDDIDGWLDALIPGVVAGEPVDTTIGGLDAVRFDVDIQTGQVECGGEFCVGFATNRLVNSMWFDPPTGYRVWWVDGGDESPIAINIGDGSDPEFTERAQAVLDTVTFESVGPNPIPTEGNLWELGIPSEVPAGSVTLPIGPGVTFEISETHFVAQGEFGANVFLDGPGESDIFFPDEAFDGASIATVDEVIAALERDATITASVVGTRDVAGFEATEIDITNSTEFGPDRPAPTFLRSGTDEDWIAPPEGTLWVMETPDGLAVITAEWFEPSAMEPAVALAAEILDSIVIGG